MAQATKGLFSWISRREIGQERRRSGWQDGVHRVLNSSIRTVRAWDPSVKTHNTDHGAIFNFDFSTDGSLLAAACERRSILMFDPHNSQLLTARANAHNDCVNCVRFLDSRTFVTCSDDTTVTIWDARYLKHDVRVLRGHSNWVKNIEYASNEGLLVTSGFDGSIYAWDINRYTERDTHFKRVFHTNGLMRSKLTPDSSKLIIATVGGYLMVVHDLDLMTLAHDLHGFKPNMYRLMQMSQSPMWQGYVYNHVFEQTRNRVEFISDFPRDNDAEMVASLQVHPQGWCVLSRNTSSDENTEWTCVHDIQDPVDGDEGEESEDTGAGEKAASESAEERVVGSPPCRQSSNSDLDVNEFGHSTNPAIVVTSYEDHVNPVASPGSPSAVSASDREEREWNQDGETSEASNAQGPGAIDTYAEPHSSESQEEPQNLENNPSSVFGDLQRNLLAETGRRVTSVSGTFIIRSGAQDAERTLLLLGQSKPTCSPRPKIHRNRKHLTNYIQEPNVGQGFIKEVCFSPDGRLICSPFKCGVRLLAFNSNCSEICDCVPTAPTELYHVTSSISHHNVVLATKFSPTQCLIVSGCLNGKVVFHQPVL